MIIINDLHLGLKRRSGVTARSLDYFVDRQFSIFEAAVRDHDHVCILGDLFTGPEIPYDLIKRVYGVLEDKDVILVLGNHDLGKEAGSTGAAQFLAWMLPSCHMVDEPYVDENNVAFVPHMVNQEAFDKALDSVAETAEVLFAHCNYDNPFAHDLDHSLNLTKAQAEMFEEVVIGHEHVKRDIGNVKVTGSPWPVNIAEAKHDHYVHTWDGVKLTPIKVWDSSSEYLEVDWREAEQAEDSLASFIRVTGTAQLSEAAQAVQNINRLRQNSSAYLVANAVEIDELEIAGLAEIMESWESFDPIAALMSVLAEKHQKRIRGIMK